MCGKYICIFVAKCFITALLPEGFDYSCVNLGEWEDKIHRGAQPSIMMLTTIDST